MLDFRGAIQCFEKALQVNPKSASAHFELGWLYDQKEVDPAAAIYHYSHYLSLKPNAENADIIKQRITTCKQALADTVYIGPLTGKIQRQLEQFGEENKRLLEQNKWLTQELARWTNSAAQFTALTNRTQVQNGEAPRLSPPARSPQTAQAMLTASPTGNTATPAQASLTTRTHTVRSGDTPSLIARKYGVKLESLMAANPNLDARRLKVGQLLRIPGS
jgi:LysM repeat protein